MTVIDEQDVDWAALRREIEASMFEAGREIGEAWFDVSDPSEPWFANRQRQQDRARARSQRDSANHRRRRKHGQRR